MESKPSALLKPHFPLIYHPGPVGKASSALPSEGEEPEECKWGQPRGQALQPAGWVRRESRTAAEGGSGAFPSFPSAFQSMRRNARHSQSRSPHSAVKLDLFPGITRSTLKKIFTEFIFTSRSPSSQGALPCPASLPAARTSSPRAATMPAFVRGTMFALPRGWGLGAERGRAAAPGPGPGLLPVRDKEEFLQECRWPADSPDQGINIHVGGEREERKEKEGPGDRYIPESVIFLCGLRVCWKFPAAPAGFTGP